MAMSGAEAEAEGPRAAGEDPAENSTLRQVELDEALARRVAWPMRAVFVALTAALFVGALVPVWRLHMSSPPADGGPRSVLVEVMSNVASGVISLDGSKV